MTADRDESPRDAPPPRRGRRWLGICLDGLLGAFLTMVLPATVLGLMGRWHWALDLFAHQRRVYAVALLVGVLWFAVRRRWVALLICGVGLGINLGLIAPLWLGSPAPPAAGSPRLRVMSFNVHTANGQTDAVADYLAASQADVVAVLEVNQRWSDRLDTVPGYRKVAAAPRPDNFGMLILQRTELRDGVAIERVTRVDADTGPHELPAFVVHLTLGGRPVQLLAVHPLPPVSPGYAASNRQTLAWVGDWARAVHAAGDAAIIVGDLNATPWSHAMRRMTRDGGLLNSQYGFGWGGSWPRPLARVGLSIPIDHCLHTQQLTTTARTLGPFLGSDHRPLTVDLALTQAP